MPDQDERRPPEHHRAAPRPRGAQQIHQRGQRDHRERRRGVDSADAGDGERAQRGHAGAGSPRTQPDDERHQHPRCEGRRPDLDRRRPRGRESIRGDRANARPARIRVQPMPIPSTPQQHDRAEEATTRSSDHHSRLGDPRRQSARSPRGEERAHREQIAVRLVLHLAEARWGPTCAGRDSRKPTGSTVRSSLVSVDDAAGCLDEGDRDQGQGPAARRNRQTAR